ncbi:MAG: hypothetical protein A2469_00970 [Candidatus Magasanikbacteria bacterium RIFOXYC2_FULL_40_16]|uniref:tetrahydrofolate synthase n=1 Tax=Candidatus Magasanikbacteria bacterium RIFOXYC2_FULL_40_16 TaxID=1798703 RepID=A0A1F6P0N6_9BACT|nr:MAG: hypothetical protein A2469_00970 [Candidatus Magasanikbacteria bacterium RIFOXYC2_FULL_40_16]
MNFKEAEQFLISLINISLKESSPGTKRSRLCLDRLNYFLGILGNPQNKIPHYIHITGTSGKGSMTAFLHSILETAGNKTGSMQSPHPTKITERWKIGAQKMSNKEFVDIINKIKIALEKHIRIGRYSIISYSEILTAIGLLYFAQNKVEWAVIEAGCGGRFDSTNVIPKTDIAIITNVGLDHEELIGPTKADIAREKAGIIKTGCKVFTAEKDKKILKIIEAEAKKQKTELNKITDYPDLRQSRISRFATIEDHRPRSGLDRGRDSTAVGTDYGLNGSTFKYKNEKYQIKAPGRHQIENAILAIEIAQSLNIKNSIIKKALLNTKQIMRLELFHNKIILDGAHNEDKINSTANFIKELVKKEKRGVHILVGFSDNKKWSKMVMTLSELKPKSISITRNTANLFRKTANPATIKKEFAKNNLQKQSEIFLQPKDALAWSMKKIKKNDILLITGSIFLSGEIRPMLSATWRGLVPQKAGLTKIK